MEREEGESLLLMTVSKDIYFSVATSSKGMGLEFNRDRGILGF